VVTPAHTAIIFVPGIRPKPPVELHAAELRRCLARALERLGNDPALAAEIAAMLRIVGWSWYFYGIHKDVESDRAGIERLLSQTDDPVKVAREATSFSRRLGKILYWLADRFPRLVGVFATNAMETRVHEVRRYFDNRHAEADTIRTMLISELRTAWQRNQQVIVLAHSFGSVIAYDALWELTHNAEECGNVDWFITMGSPLTMKFMRRRIRGAELEGAMRYPANIRRWYNFAALGEVTAFDTRLADCFARMLDLGLVETIEDDLTILNEYREPDGLNVHKCYGYLANPTIAALVREAWDMRGG
jgi:O6-methylguanine-DNA--protein-cysteine methyltransferase